MSIFNDPKIGEYIEYIRKFDVYTKEEELEAFKKLKNGDSEIREDIILHNLRLVVSIASRYVSKNSNFSFFEVLSFGNEGLIYAIDKYDIDNGCAFSTYASKCIDFFIRTNIRKEIFQFNIPKNLKSVIIKYNKLVELYFNTHGCYPTDEYILKNFDIDCNDLKLIQNNPIDVLSLDLCLDPDEDSNLYNTIEDKNCNVENEIEEKIQKEYILEIIDEAITSESQKEAFLYYSGIDREKLNLADIGKKMGFTRQNAYIKLSSAVKRLKKNNKIKEIVKKNNNTRH